MVVLIDSNVVVGQTFLLTRGVSELKIASFVILTKKTYRFYTWSDNEHIFDKINPPFGKQGFNKYSIF